MTTTIKERALEIAKNKGITIQEFCKSIGMTYGNFKGTQLKTSLNSHTIDKIISIFPDTNPLWLITGNGEMFRVPLLEEVSTHNGEIRELARRNVMQSSNVIVGLPKGEIVHRHHKVPTKRREGSVKFYDVEFTAGNMELQNTPGIEMAYEMDIPEFNGCTAFRTYNDSMEPLIKSGTIIFTTRIEQWEEGVEWGQIYGLVLTDGRRMLKYVKKHKTNDKKWLLVSENDFYDDMDLPIKMIKSVWLVHGWINKKA